VLTGKYRPGAAPDKETRAGRNDTRMMQTEWRPVSLRLARQIRQHAEARGITAGQYAVSWVFNSSPASSPVRASMSSGRLRARARLSFHRQGRILDRPHPSTPGYNDPQYPIEGRKPRTSG